MLNQETKQKIKNARDILVGKVPDPKAQVEQITFALIYKFMDDMDKQSQELGGKSQFFTNGYEKYAWSKILDSKLGGHERLELYAEAIAKMSENPHIPQLFRDVFKDAFLPYRSPETLTLFLKEINGFSYDHSEDLGDAFEYLLSVLGSQGDAGQFRTPRHIIDFIVDVVNPKKDESILDPACGTAGFLISAYKHIIKENKNKPLSPDEKSKLTKNLVGYDISPDMVRLSKVNMYLHGFAEPKIYEYDTLSSEDKWDEMYDVIMANPPFMTPKGGIRPHKRFSVQANRSEVLFVDYIKEHLKSNGRAGIIVPEGIIFQTANAYKALRRLLIEDGLFAVVSLPAGVFNPYSGVKTSILFFDNKIVKQADNILFIKITNDGFDLGAQRRKLNNDGEVPIALQILRTYREGFEKGVGKKFKLDKSLDYIAWFAPKNRVVESGDYNLTGDRYVETISNITYKYELVELEKICMIQSGSRQRGGAIMEGVPSIGGEQIAEDGSLRINKMKYVSKDHYNSMKSGKLSVGDVLLVKDGATTGKTGFYSGKNSLENAAVNEHVFILRAKKNILPFFLYNVIKSEYFQKKLKRYIKGIIGGISLEIKEIKVPLPPIDVQTQIVKEIESKEEIIENAKGLIQKVERERANSGQIFERLDCEKIKIGDILSLEYGKALKEINRVPGEYPVFGSNGVVGYHNKYLVEGPFIIIGRKGSAGAITYSDKNGFPIDTTFFVKLKNNKVALKYMYWLLKSLGLNKINTQSGVPGLNRNDVYKIMIPIPNNKEQQKIVNQFEKQEFSICANNELIQIFTDQIKEKMAEILGE